MALTETEQTAAARRASGGVTGAAAGAKLGASAAGPWGALIGGVLGAGAGAIGAGGLTDEEKERARRIEEIRRLRAMDMLGLSPDERALMEAQMVGSVKQAERQQQEAFLRATASQDVGSGSFFKQAQSQDDATLAELADARARIEAANLDQANQQRKELQNLLDEQGDQMTEERRALLMSLIGAAETGIEIGTDLGEGQLVKEDEAALEASKTQKQYEDSEDEALDIFDDLWGTA